MYRKPKAGEWDRCYSTFALTVVSDGWISKKKCFKFFSGRFPLHIRKISKPRRDMVTAILDITKPNFLVPIPLPHPYFKLGAQAAFKIYREN